MNNALDLIYSPENKDKNIANFYEQYNKVNEFNYYEIIENSVNYAINLKEMIAVKNEPILISLETSADFLFSFFGIILSGNIPVPIASATLLLPKDFKELVKQIAKSCQASYIVSNQVIKSTNINLITPTELKNKRNTADFKVPSINKDDTCFIQFSSGSTQLPKGVAVTHENLLANLKQIKQGMQVTRQDRICSWLPLYHDMGLIGVLLASLYCEVESFLMSPLDFILSPKQWIQLLSKEKISIIVAPNTAYNACIKKVNPSSIQNLDLSHIRLALSGAEPVNAKICRNFLEHFKDVGLKSNVMFPVYGLAEATLAVSFNPLEQPLKTLELDYDQLTQKNTAADANENTTSIEVVACGSALEGLEIEIRQEQKNLSENHVGEIFIKGPNIVPSYYQRDSHLYDGWLATGDLGFLRDGLLYIVGRVKDLIIVNGRNIAANDIEAKICQIDQFKLGKTVAFSYLDSNNQEKVKIVAEVCETNKSARQKLKEEVCHRLKALFPLLPEDVYILPPLMIKKTTSGKVKRYYVKQKYMVGKIKRWEKMYSFYFLRSQVVISLMTFKFALKNMLYKMTGRKIKQDQSKEQEYHEVRN